MRLNTFGRAHVSRDGTDEMSLQPLAVALLAYLAVGGPRDRDHLADLFWHNSKNGLNSLSTTLNRIRAEAPDSLWVKGNNLVGTDLKSDIGDLHDAIDRSDFELVVQLYSAPFLGNLRLRRQSVEFEEWMLEQRTTLAATVELALLQRGRDLFDVGEHQTAAIAVEEAWGIAIRDGFPSPDNFEIYHRILASAASPTANAVRSMAGEFGVVLLPVELVASESDTAPVGASGPVPTSSAGDDSATSDATPLFGCDDELDAITSSVASERLTTIVGLGGSGKTRLANEYFNSSKTQRDFHDRYWVNLRDVADQELVGPAIATSLGQRFDTVASLAKQIPDDQPVLLVLDNFEHVLDAAEIAEELTHENGTLRILVTSRVPLEVASESLVKLTGLDTADHEPDSPAEQLFVSSARRAGVSNDRVGGPNRVAVRDICRRVGGNPLALEIAGGWTQIFSPTEILDALSLSNELLDSSMAGDLRTMDTVLNQSWATLTETEQNTMMLLATFPSGCLSKEAFKLRELPISSIGRLVQHSLVRLDSDGRITLHPLISSHALAELEKRPDQHQAFQQVLSTWCQSFAATAEADPDDAGWHAFEAEIANFVSAWSWDGRYRLWDLHRATLGSLRQFFTKSGRNSEGRALFTATVDALRADSNPPNDLLAEALEALGWFQSLSGESATALTTLSEALNLSPENARHARAQILRSLGVLQITGGEIDEATANLTAGLALIADDDPSALTASLQYDLAQAYNYRGDRDQATSAARLALQAGRAANDRTMMTMSYLLLADMAIETDPEHAIVLLNEGWVIAKDASLDNLAIYFPSVLGLAHLKLNEPDLAESYFTDGIEAANSVGQLMTVCANHICRAEARLLRQRTDDAVEDIKTGIRLALKTKSGRYLMWAAVVSCRATVTHEAPSSKAKELLLLALRHPAADQDVRDKATATLLDLFDAAPPPNQAPASESDEATLDEIAERSLRLLTQR